ncbi:GNAT family N-acetyltransferase [Sporosarcina sp. BI001-red]|uniref:GNAT family N-acetyltransferase n=1 Tax=Sporosarcina sp. BI001-red TaxID=2282866 RepID=UPI000E258DE8|nr:GNAT family N-acetyltransferase [Sporosarcina sp. BI001-red]REB08625.1 GNAT family N-acetyltransferase [Sporosarcina sp. BI001-red]
MLTANHIEGIQHLQQQCEQYDKIELKLNWEMLRERKNDTMDFFIWKDHELIAYLALYGFGSTVEVCGMVKPEERRNGHFTNLWQQAQRVIEDKEFKKVLFNAPGTSESAKGWMAIRPCNYSFSEFHMHWHHKELSKTEGIVLRESTLEDKAFETALDAEAFSFSLEDAESYYNERLPREKECRYIIEVDEKPIGKIRVMRNLDESYISGFAVLSECRGQGYGGKALQWIVKQELPTGNIIKLDVETKNDNALKLYERIGFVQQERQDYYDVPVALVTN